MHVVQLVIPLTPGLSCAGRVPHSSVVVDFRGGTEFIMECKSICGRQPFTDAAYLPRCPKGTATATVVYSVCVCKHGSIEYLLSRVDVL